MSGDHDDDAAEPASVTPDDWRETERWLDEWSGRVATDDALVGGPAAPATSSAPAEQAGPIVPGGPDVRPAPGDPPPAPEAERVAESALPAGYLPPNSPAYAADGRPAPPPVARPPREAAPSAPLVVPPPPDEGLRTTPTTRGRQRAGRLLALGVVVVVIALAAALVLALGDDEPSVVTLGEVSTVAAGATVRTGSRTSPLEAGTVIEAGDVVRAPADGAVAIDLDGGGSVRFDSGASVTFIDEAIDPETGERDGESRPVFEVLAGRVWVNPADGTAVEVVLPGGRVTSEHNPVAIECPGDCSLQAPAGGVDIDADSGADAAPAPSEIVDLRPDGSMGLQIGVAETAWATQNLEGDRADGLDAPAVTATPGVVASAVLDGSYPFRIDVVGEAQGDALPDALRYGPGETYSLALDADGSACPPTSCQVPVTAADDGATGTADVGGAAITVTFTQPINCYDEARQNVVVAGIGTTTVTASLQVGNVAQDGTRWRITTASGSGSVATNLTSPCNPGDVLGTSTSSTSVTVG